MADHAHQQQDHQTGAQPGELAGGEPAVVAVHDQDVQKIHGAHADQRGDLEHIARLTAHFAPEECGGGAQAPQVVKDIAVVQGDGHAPRVADDHRGKHTDDGDEQKHHQIHGEGLQEVILVHDPALGHISPVEAEVARIAVVVVQTGHLIGITPVDFARLVQGDLAYPVVVITVFALRSERRDQRVEKVLCKVVAVRAVGVEKVHRSLPIRCDAAGDRLVVRIVEDVKSGGSGEKVKVCITCKRTLTSIQPISRS